MARTGAKSTRVVPYVNGKLEGDYAKFFVDGRPEWRGQFENGRRVGSLDELLGLPKRTTGTTSTNIGESGYDPEVSRT